MAARRVSELDLDALRGREFFPSPAAWEDQVLYLLMLDRFSSGEEGEPFRPGDAETAVRTEAEAAQWRDAGKAGVGGTLRGLTSRIGYRRPSADMSIPHETRPKVVTALETLQTKREPGPKRKHGNIPL
jgi:hypothetical protein